MVATPYAITTFRDLIRLALQSFGAIEQGEDVSADEENDALMVMNEMLDDFSTESLLIYTVQRRVYNLAGITQTYTYGPGGNWDPTPDVPAPIEDVYIMLQQANAQTTELPVRIVSYDEWAAIPVKSTQSPIPLQVWIDYQNPLCNFSFYPIPNNSSYQIVLYTWQTLGQVTNITNSIIFPKGYASLIRKNLALRLLPHYGKSRTDEPDIAVEASEAKKRVKLINQRMKTLLMTCDAALIGTTRTFNYLTGESS
jgi:hypothetical protein